MAKMLNCPAGQLVEFVDRVFRCSGAEPDIAGEVASHLVRSNLSGHDSHGVIRVAQYVGQIDKGEIVPSARPVVLRETPSTALIDARFTFGHFSTAFALEWVLDHARQAGVAVAAVRHSCHIGRLGEYTERAAERDLVGIVTVGVGGPGVGGLALYGARQRFFGANPWSFGVPAADRSPMMFDGSSSAVAEGKVRLARAKGTLLPEGCIVDKDGNPATDPEDFYAGGALLPLGGPVAGHKGYGLAMASMLIGALAMIDDDNPSLVGAAIRQEVNDERGRAAGVFVMAIDPAFFGDAVRYRAMVSESLAAAKRMPPAAGADEVLVPGEPEVRMRAQRTRDGVPLPEATWNDLVAVAERFGLPLPAVE